jgi:hypothetical protein
VRKNVLSFQEFQITRTHFLLVAFWQIEAKERQPKPEKFWCQIYTTPIQVRGGKKEAFLVDFHFISLNCEKQACVQLQL